MVVVIVAEKSFVVYLLILFSCINFYYYYYYYYSKHYCYHHPRSNFIAISRDQVELCLVDSYNFPCDRRDHRHSHRDHHLIIIIIISSSRGEDRPKIIFDHK